MPGRPEDYAGRVRAALPPFFAPVEVADALPSTMARAGELAGAGGGAGATGGADAHRAAPPAPAASAGPVSPRVVRRCWSRWYSAHASRPRGRGWSPPPPGSPSPTRPETPGPGGPEPGTARRHA